MMKSLLPRSMTLAALALLCSQAQAETLQTGKDVEAPHRQMGRGSARL